jgi:PAS domain S-box-containing protein
VASSASDPNPADTGQARISLAELPPTSRQTRAALVAAAVLLLGLAVLLPSAAQPIPRVNGFVPAIDAIIFVADLITAGLLWTQFSISRSRALLALGCGYLFAAVLVVAHALTFPGAFSETGNFGGRPHTNFRVYLLWHLGLPAALLAYAWLRAMDHKRLAAGSPRDVAAVLAAAGLCSLIACVVYLAVLPPVAPVAGRWLTFATMLICAAALAVVCIVRRSALDQWLMVVALTMIVELAITALVGGRGPNLTTLGFYTGRLFSIATSSVVLGAMLSETTALYTGVARTNLLLLLVGASRALSNEIELPALIARLARISIEHARADRVLVILPSGTDYLVRAEGRTSGQQIDVAMLEERVSPRSCPESVIRHVIRTREIVVLDGPSVPTGASQFALDPYLQLHGPRSVLCIPLVHQDVLRGLLYLESAQTPLAFAPERTRLLELLASQAAISLESATLYAELQIRVGLLELLPVSAWTLKPDGTPDFVNAVWLEFSGQTPDYVQSHPEAWMTAIHPEDREAAVRIFRDGVRSGQGFAFETRSLRARDGTYRWHLQQAVVLRDADGSVVKFVGTTTDIDDLKRAEATLRQAQADLAHVARVATLNAMTASIAHEVSQPVSAILNNANTGARMLAADPPDLVGAAETVRRTVRDANRATEVIRRLRAMFSTRAATLEMTDLNEVARDVIALSTGEMQRSGARLQTDFAVDLPLVSVDRVQLQQVILNLLLNAAEAMAEVQDRPRVLLVRTDLHDEDSVRLDVRDSGVGVDPDNAARLFEAFYTTKPQGMGVGLSISRSIIERHEGRLWAETNDGAGATFSFLLPRGPAPFGPEP